MRASVGLAFAFVAAAWSGGCNAILGISDVRAAHDGQTAADTRVATDAPPGAPDATPCHAGDTCMPANQCHKGITTCEASGQQSCIDTQTNVMDGTTCAQGTCSSGVCSDPCGSVACNTPPAATCSDPTTVSGFDPAGTCSVQGGNPQCGYTPMTIDCAAMSKLCQNGACVDPPDAADVPDAM